ncbi:hypothetical protein DXG03_006460 [Asterophora parasitica]|uniref:non-specific serine/threonine protein kinase n=1 Tax=Asterophora parasitica TaxID=117018 RepID=A0A9P7K9B9_9AGAR|nr:hypothetical protein DXG03_006460 [Asterophora parasitica]
MSFPEEPLNLTSQEGFGYYPGQPGQVLNGGQYQIPENRSATPKEYEAVKILTVNASEMVRASDYRELKIHEAVNKFNETSGPYTDVKVDLKFALSALLTYFDEKSHHGSHLCLALSLQSHDLNTFIRSAPSKSLPLHSVKTVIAHAAEGLSGLHGAGIVHGDAAIKPSNWVFDDSFEPEDIDSFLSSDPPVVEREVEVERIVYPVVRSQPFVWRVWNDDKDIVELQYHVNVKGFGHAQWHKDGLLETQMGLEKHLQPPEVILGAGYKEKADIWAFGCATFELLTGRPLIMPYTSQEIEPEQYYLAQMASITGETFAPQTLQRSPVADKFFDESGKPVHPISESILTLLTPTRLRQPQSHRSRFVPRERLKQYRTTLPRPDS